MISFENKVILFHFKIFVNVKYHGHEKYMDEDCTRKVATATCTIYTDHENMKTIYFLILNEIVEYFINLKVLTVACVKYPYNT